MEKVQIMREVVVGKLTLNIGAGKDQSKLDKGMELFKTITGKVPIKTFTNKRIQEWGLRPGLPIGCKVTLREGEAVELLKRLIEAKDGKLTLSQFDDNGNISFGIREYIDIPGVKYDPKIGIIGLQVCVTLERPGFRVKRRSFMKRKIGNSHKITREEAISFMKDNFNIRVGEGNEL
ncbi:50S ribosomal protein L5 [Candidatus Woesearchaeota archaeon]|nr:50S ribosomal protein L5 [Candidatus Woesearchaeota archaeon]